MKKINLNFTSEQKQQLKNLVEEEGFNFLDDIESAKNDLNILSLSVKEAFGISPTLFKKLVTINYKNSLEDERLKFDAIDTLYSEVFGDHDELEEDTGQYEEGDN